MFSTHLYIMYYYLFPLMYVAYEATETEETKQAEQLNQPKHFERSASPSQLILFAALFHQQKNVVERYRAEKVDKEPGFQVVFGDEARLQYDLVNVVVLQNAFFVVVVVEKRYSNIYLKREILIVLKKEERDIFKPVLKLTTMSSKNIESLTRLNMSRPVWLQLSLKNEMATGKMITLAINNISITKSQQNLFMQNEDILVD